MTGLSLITTFLSLPNWVLFGVLGLWFPQLMWFNKMVRGSIKVIRDGVKRMDSQDKQKKPVLAPKSEDTEDSNLEEEKCQKLE